MAPPRLSTVFLTTLRPMPLPSTRSRGLRVRKRLPFAGVDGGKHGAPFLRRDHGAHQFAHMPAHRLSLGPAIQRFGPMVPIRDALVAVNHADGIVHIVEQKCLVAQPGLIPLTFADQPLARLAQPISEEDIDGGDDDKCLGVQRIRIGDLRRTGSWQHPTWGKKQA